MGIWKGRKKERPDARIMMCPECHGRNLRFASRTGIILGQPRLLCPDCGYNGSVYVDINPNDANEEDMEADFMEDNAEFVNTRKSAAELASLSLEIKWNPDQAHNTHTLREWCPFCEDVDVVCKICKCIPTICSDHATAGWIGQLNAMYDDETLLCNVDAEIYAQIVRGFQDLAKESGPEI